MLSSGVVFTSRVALFLVLPSPEEIAAQKEAEERKATLALMWHLGSQVN